MLVDKLFAPPIETIIAFIILKKQKKKWISLLIKKIHCNAII